MISNAHRRIRTATQGGHAWPGTGDHNPEDIADPFGPRAPFSPHVSTVGFSYDFHRGIDCVEGQPKGSTVYSPLNGSVVRRHFTHFDFVSNSSYLTGDRIAETDPNGEAVFTEASARLEVATSSPASRSFGTGVARLVCTEKLQATGDDWSVQVEFSAVPSLPNGAAGIAIYDPDSGEYAALEYDGTDVAGFGGDSGGGFFGGSPGIAITSAVASQTWLQLQWDDGTSTLSWEYGTDGDSWTSLTTDNSVSWSNPSYKHQFEVWLYWRPTATGADDDFFVNFFGFVDDKTIGRFGNFLVLANKNEKFVMVHFSDLSVEAGDRVQVGDELGTTGNTGFDFRSGRILNPHCHVEYHSPDNGAIIDQTQAINPLDPDVLPRDDVTNNVSVSRTEENDPNGDASWKLTVDVSRGSDQGFDVNEISLTGNSATRTVNLNTRAGINSDVDVPDESGVYLDSDAFDENDSTYRIEAYFEKAVVGSTFVSAFVKDTAGTTLWSE